jgi:hypothetical protein
VSPDGASIAYTLSYTTLWSDITQSHVHFGRPATTGMIVLFLCTNVGLPTGVNVPMPQACPPGPVTISGTLTAADVIARDAQNSDAGAAGFAEMIKAMLKAMRAGPPTPTRTRRDFRPPRSGAPSGRATTTKTEQRSLQQGAGRARLFSLAARMFP